MRTLRSAFSLVELSIVLAILGVVAAAGLSVGTTIVEQQANIASNAKLEEIDKALRDYFMIYERLPCPADPTLAPGAANFGQPVNSNSCNVAGALNNTVETNNVRIGALPIRALGLRDREIADEFGNRYTYAVTRQHTVDKATFEASAGAIRIFDGGGGSIASDGSYIVISHGSDGKGARRYQTGTAIPVGCGADGATAPRDVDNCDNDRDFRDARFNNGAIAENFFDDFVRWMPKFRLLAISGGSSSGLWSNTGDGVIYSLGTDSDHTNTNVGIGTTTSNARLTVQRAAGASLDPATSFTDGTQWFRINPHSTSGAWSPLAQAGDNVLSFSNGTIENGGLTIAQWSASPRGMRITSAGDIGMGTAAPAAPLEVLSGVNYPIVTRTATNGVGATSGVGFLSNSGILSDSTLMGAVYSTVVQGSPLQSDLFFRVNQGNNTNPIAVMRYNGRMGLGTSLPGAKLHVVGDAILVESGTVNEGGEIWLGGPTNFPNDDFLLDNYQGQFRIIRTNPTGMVVMQMAQNGNVAVGSAPGGDRFTVNGDILANNYYITSDARMKHDIKPAFKEAALQIVAGITPVHFTWNKDNTKDIGVIAQDVEKVLPEAISKDEKGFRRVAYEKLILPVIEAVTQLHEIVTGLIERISKAEERITALQKENEALKVRLDKLERLLEKDKSHKIGVNNE